MPSAVWLLCILTLLVGLGWSVVTPPLRGLDEPAQVDLARHLADGGAYPQEPRALAISDGMLAAQHLDEDQNAGSAPILAPREDGDWRADARYRDTRYRVQDADPRLTRPPFLALEQRDPAPGRASVPNRAADQPPLPAVAGAGVLAAVPDTASYDVQAWLLRVLGALVLAPVPLLAHLATRWLVDDRRAALTAATLPLVLPTLSHLTGAGSSVPWLALAGGVLALGLARLTVGDTRLATGLLLGVGLGLGAASHAVGLAWPLALLAAVPVARHHGGATTGHVARVVGFAAALAGVLGGWWWVVRPPTPAVLDPVGVVRGTLQDGGLWLTDALWWLAQGMVGRIGWDELALPGPIVAVVLVVLLVAVVATQVGPWRPARATRAALAPQLVVVVATAVLALAGAGRVAAEHGVRAGPDGHLLLGGIVGLAVVAGVGLVAGPARWARPMAPVALVAATALQLALVLAALQRWWGPAELEPVIAVRAVMTWAAVPLGTQLAIGAGLVVVLLVTGWRLTRQTATARPTPTEGGRRAQQPLADRPR